MTDETRCSRRSRLRRNIRRVAALVQQRAEADEAGLRRCPRSLALCYADLPNVATVRALLFDLDGTLFDRDASVRGLVINQHHRFGAALSHVAAETYVERVVALDAHGHGDKTVAYQQVVTDFALPVSLAAALTADFWATYQSFCRGFPQVLPVLAELHQRGLKLAVVTNGSVEIQEPVIQRLGIAGLLDTVVISEREGVRKPDREIFHRALRSLGVGADEAWYVGDHPAVDIEGASAAGLTAVWRRTAYWPAPHPRYRTIESLDDLLGLIPEAP
jgi:putative hydrolase of the HAD superfamily